MQFCSPELSLRHELVPIDPALGYTPTCPVTHSPPPELTMLHYHDSMEIGYCYEGSGVFLVDGHVLPFQAGCASIIAPRSLHIARSAADAPSQWRFMNLEPARLMDAADGAWLNSPHLGEGSILPPDDGESLPLLARELLEESARQDAAAAVAVRGLAQCLLARLSRRGSRRATGGAAEVSAALQHIAESYAQPVDLLSLATACGMAPSTFRRAFQRAVGRPPGDYIHGLRIQMAALRLRAGNDAVLEVALSVGYDSLSAFNRQFRARMGHSPREYRKKQSTL